MSNIVEIPNALGDTGIGVGFYTRAEAARIARIPRRTLDAWRQKRIVLESIEWENEEGKREVGYTFDALVYLRLIRMLRENNIVLRKALHAVSELTKRFGPPSPAWQSVRSFSWGDDVFVNSTDEWKTTTATRSSQKAADILFGEEFEQLRDRSDALLVPRNFQRHVEIDPSKRNGHPVVLTTTIPTSLVHALCLQSLSYSDVHQEYPFISTVAVQTAHEFEHFLDVESIAA